MSRSQVEIKHYFITHFGYVTTFHVLWCIVLFHVAWECDCVVQTSVEGGAHTCRGTETQMSVVSQESTVVCSAALFVISQQDHLLPSPHLDPPWNLLQ